MDDTGPPCTRSSTLYKSRYRSPRVSLFPNRHKTSTSPLPLSGQPPASLTAYLSAPAECITS